MMAENKNPVGRPPAMTPAVIAKLEDAWLYGCSDLEACFSADISKDVLYNYQQEHPEFTERKERLKENPIYKARKAVVDKLPDDPELALKFLERKRKDEFSTRQEVRDPDATPAKLNTTLELATRIAFILARGAQQVDQPITINNDEVKP